MRRGFAPTVRGGAALNAARIHFRGHAELRATDPGAIELLTGDGWASRSRIIGHQADYDPEALLALRGRVRATLAVGDAEDVFEATIAPGFTRGIPLVIRREPAGGRLLGVSASKGAADLDRGLVERLRRPDATGVLTLAPIDGDPPPGLLALVGMPIGHQGDLSPRALDMLMSVDLILAEDTRVAQDALGWRGVRTPLKSCDAHREAARAAEVVRDLAAGRRIAFISDAGLPAVSDPGAALVRAAVAAGASVTAIPGPSAVPLALALSGFGGGGFAFHGFPPRKGPERRAFLDRLLSADMPTLAFEAPSRVAALVGDLAMLAPGRPAALCRDLTKVSETVMRGTLSALAEDLQDHDGRGEFVLVVAPDEAPPAADEPPATLDIEAFVAALIDQNCPTAPIVGALREQGIDRRDAYALVQRLKDERETR